MQWKENGTGPYTGFLPTADVVDPVLKGSKVEATQGDAGSVDFDQPAEKTFLGAAQIHDNEGVGLHHGSGHILTEGLLGDLPDRPPNDLQPDLSISSSIGARDRASIE